jgi:peptide-methionine (S)-S-oxide reductase
MSNQKSFSGLGSMKNPPILILIVAACFFYLLAGALTGYADPGRDMAQAPPIDLSKPYTGKAERALFAGGCFWGTQYSFQELPGVTNTIVGYTGGHTVNPTYQQVCGHQTGQAETVYVEFDPKKLSYRQLVDFFWTIHDPTTRDRQGFDMGDQYRSAIFYTSPEQKTIAETSKKQAQQSGKFRDTIVTQIVPATVFYPAEEYHQNYDIKHGSRSCAAPAK